MPFYDTMQQLIFRREVHTTGLYIPNANPPPSSPPNHTYESLPSSLPTQQDTYEAAPSSLPIHDRTYESIPSSLPLSHGKIELPEYAYVGGAQFGDKSVPSPDDGAGGRCSRVEEHSKDCDIDDNPAYQPLTNNPLYGQV